jgi:hypothetical protein
MIYSGQELPNKKRLKFFDKDQIDWDGNFELCQTYGAVKRYATFEYLRRQGIHCSSCPEPLLNKITKVHVNKQKFSDACPAQMKLIAIKCPLIQRYAPLAQNPMLN